MTDQTETFEGGELFANKDERTVSGVLMPWGKLSRRPLRDGKGYAAFDRGGLKVPRDISIVSANVEHDHFTPVARATSIEDTESGLVATFSVANTDEGDNLLDLVAEGKLRNLSAEVKNVQRTDAERVTAQLTGAAFVSQGAFAGAELFSLEVSEEDTEETPSPEFIADFSAQIGAAFQAAITSAVSALNQTSEAETSDAPTTETPTPEAPAITKEDAVAEAVAPESFSNQENTTEQFGKESVFDSIIKYRKTGDASALAVVKEATINEAFALSDVKTTGAGSLGVDTIQSNWLGELWAGDKREREIVPLFKHADLTSFEVKGFAFGTKPTMQTWTGNKSAIGSPAYTITTKTAGIQRFAAGYDIAREFFDISAGGPVIESFLDKLADSYAEVSDDYVLSTIVAALTGVEATTYPTGVGEGWGKIIQGMQALRVKRARADFAVVAADVAAAMDFTLEDDRLALFSQVRGGLSGINYVVSDQLADGQVLVGDSRAATVFELPGAPIRVNALDIALGGVDEAMFAYISVLIENPDALVLITDDVA